MSIAIFAILLNTLERTHKRNTKKCLELALKCLKLAELVKNGTKLLLFTAFTTFCISLYGKTSKCRIGTCWSCGVNLVLNAAGNSKSAKVATPFSRNTIRLPDLMISWSSPSIYQNDHKIFNKHHLAAVPDGFEKKGHDHNHCCFHCHLMISVFKKTSWGPKFWSPYQWLHLEKWTVWWSSRMNGFSIRLTFKMSEISVMAEEWIQYLYSWTLSLTDVQLIKDI